MGVFTSPWTFTTALLAFTYFHSSYVSASPSINVSLKAAFDSAPYLLELLETAAEENATSYFPLLDRVAEGRFAKATTEEELYTEFIKVLKNDNHMLDEESLSLFQLSLSIRSTAPRIEAHYQYYRTAVEPSLTAEQDDSCHAWVLFNGKQYCSHSFDSDFGDVKGSSQTQELPFDRLIGSEMAPAYILYADITSPIFGKFHKNLMKLVRDGKASYRVRYRKLSEQDTKPLVIPGYGVELALKRTDYIVIDDRVDGDENAGKQTVETDIKLDDEELSDLKPLSTSELLNLGIKASSFVMQSESPFDTLIKLSQDFPKYSSAIASHNSSTEFIAEHQYNRAQLVPAGYNVWWINGVQMIERQIDALSLLQILRRERKLINSVRELGLTSLESIQLLAHDEISGSKSGNEPQRYDWRDEYDGGNVIIWMNDIEKDKRYKDWPSHLAAMLQRTFPGQLPQVRKDIFNLIVPVDFSNTADIHLVVEVLQSFVKRKLALRIGLVPLTKSAVAIEQARILYHLLDTYGLSSAIAYLEDILSSQKTGSPSKASFQKAIDGRNLKAEKVAVPLDAVFNSDISQERIDATGRWTTRLAVDGKVLPFFIDGVALPRDENWLQSMSNRVTLDLQNVQQGIFEEVFTEDMWIPNHFLSNSALKRNPLIIPEDEDTIKIFDMNKLIREHEGLFKAPRLEIDTSLPKSDWAYMILIADFDSKAGQKLLFTAGEYCEANAAIELILIHNPLSDPATPGLSGRIYKDLHDRSYKPYGAINDLRTVLTTEKHESENTEAQGDQDAAHYWNSFQPLVKSVGLLPGQNGILLSGRLIGPIPEDLAFNHADFEQTGAYERSKRLLPVYKAIDALGLSDKVVSPLAASKLSSVVAISTISDAPEGIFEQAPPLRYNQFHIWNSSYTAIEVGDISTATIQLTVLVDPTSEQAQRWIPILKVLSQLEGVYLKLFLNPKERLQELPVKRFYRYVLESKPSFTDAGALRPLGATFTGVPLDALLTVGMDVPPAWLVSPKVSVYDLDNIKLSSVKTNVEAVYELEHILIEGHSRELPNGNPPRGAQLVLGTERNAHFADTIIMANLGYFQFKANPGFYKIGLLDGRSSEIYNIESLGSQGWSPVPGDESTDIALMSFQGVTLYPRLTRKPGMETEDVLESRPESAMDFLHRGYKFAESLLAPKEKTAVPQKAQAEINIFSVASGHLYERMLNIMMVSVMRHTKHTVKFWFIEQFLSPSFKDFIPYMAAEYGFEYEMVTYKWPHWLRAQKEKQREIWGYKILFLDVLFPLSLDKVIFVDADQIVRTDMIELVNHDLEGAPYGFTPMCDSRTEMEGFRFWKQGYWKNYLRGLPYHISALYVVDLRRFRQMAAGDRLRQQYHQLSADPGSLSNLDQDLPNHMQMLLKIHSLPQEWLWCETWCSDESLADAKTIDLCNNPMTKEPKLDRARRQVPEWTVYDNEIAALDRRRKGLDDSMSGETKESTNTKSRNHDESVSSKKRDEL
ncbi:UDP-glucose:glycoprotein glucosyltransferase-domain-containing protein [Xylogone sp. PMI_703]|nr:UDP-glucose:glycoprotein glucosyltransferase-domain-containing protein [Xylogone sp. PMI_703]